MSVDPELRRSVIVSTKLDTRVPQFSQREDVEFFLHPPPKILESTILGGAPFFTSVPSGRVGTHRDAAFPSNEAFRDSVRERETRDVTDLERLLDRPLDSSERARCGVSRLRKFLEELLQRRYLENVPSIVPLLEKEHHVLKQQQQAGTHSDAARKQHFAAHTSASTPSAAASPPACASGLWDRAKAL